MVKKDRKINKAKEKKAQFQPIKKQKATAPPEAEIGSDRSVEKEPLIDRDVELDRPHSKKRRLF